MNKIYLKLIPFVLALFFFACTADEWSEEFEDDSLDIEAIQDLFEKGYIRIKVSEDLSTRMEMAEQNEGLATRGMQADDILDKVKVRKMRRTFPYAGEFEERTRKEGMHLWYDVEFDSEIPLSEISTQFMEIAGVAEIELRPVVHNYGNGKVLEYVKEIAAKQSSAAQTSSAPFNDPMLSDQWHYQNDGSLGSTYKAGADINLFNAWDYESGSPEVIVSIVDGGIDFEHEDLAANMWVNVAERDGTNNVDDDRNGYVDDIHGYNFVAKIGRINPEDHGTHVAGTVAAVNNNKKGVAGVAGGDGSRNSGVRLMSCQIFVPEDDPYSDQGGRNGAEAIKYGADNGAVISQNSWGYSEGIQIPGSDKAAIDYFIKYAGTDKNGNQTGPMKGGLVVFAAGNEDRNQAPPANYEPVVAVSSIAPDYKKAYYSNFGSWVNIAAPGGDVKSFGNKGTVLSTIVGNKYGYMQGTSMACPHVSGVAALIVSKMKGTGLEPETIKAQMVSSGRSIDSYNTSYRNQLGVLVDATLSLAGGGTVAPDKVLNLKGSAKSNILSLNWTVPRDDDDGKPSGFKVFIRKRSLSGINLINPPADVITRTFAIGDKTVGATFEATVDDLEFETKYYIAVTAYDVSGNTSELSSQINLTTEINNPPIITTSDETTFEVKAHEVRTIKFEGSDPDGHDIEWKLDPVIEGVQLSEISKGVAHLTISGLNVAPGNYKTNVVLKDKYNAESKIELIFEVFENRPPEILKNIDDLMINGQNQQLNLSLEEYFTDKDEEILSYSIENSTPNVLHANTDDGILYLVSLRFGMSNLTITATDALGESVKQSFKVLVRDSDTPVDIYPNPVKDNVWVRTDKETSCKITISSSSGALVYEAETNSSPFAPHMINVSSLAAGVYNMKVVYDNVEYKKQIIKQ